MLGWDGYRDEHFSTPSCALPVDGAFGIRFYAPVARTIAPRAGDTAAARPGLGRWCPRSSVRPGLALNGSQDGLGILID